MRKKYNYNRQAKKREKWNNRKCSIKATKGRERVEDKIGANNKGKKQKTVTVNINPTIQSF